MKSLEEVFLLMLRNGEIGKILCLLRVAAEDKQDLIQEVFIKVRNNPNATKPTHYKRYIFGLFRGEYRRTNSDWNKRYGEWKKRRVGFEGIAAEVHREPTADAE